MSGVFDKAFDGIRAALCEKVDLSHGLLLELLDRAVITKAHKDSVEAIKVEQEQVNKLISILVKRPDNMYQAFCEALRSCQQEHIIKILKVPETVASTQHSYTTTSSVGSSGHSRAIPMAPSACSGGDRMPVLSYCGSSSGVASGYNAMSSCGGHSAILVPNSQNSSQSTLASVAQLRTIMIPAEVQVIQFSALQQLESIAEGGFGMIYRAHHTQWGTVAYKELKATVINPKDKFARELQREVQAHILRHQNVIAILGTIFEPSHYGIVLEYALHHGLDTFIGRFEVEWIMKLSIAYGIVLGMNYLHTKDPPVIHGELRLQNVLVADGYVAKICDFGLSKWRQYSTTRTPSRTVRGTVAHIPPENWINVNERRTTKYDMYSFGIMLWELLSEKAPFGDDCANIYLIQNAVTKNQRPDLDNIDEQQLMPDGLRGLIKDSITTYWAQQPADRPSFGDVKEIFNGVMIENAERLQTAICELDKQVQAYS
jgi:hypothetical protein